jgi:hypothetical protein
VADLGRPVVGYDTSATSGYLLADRCERLLNRALYSIRPCSPWPA